MCRSTLSKSLPGLGFALLAALGLAACNIVNSNSDDESTFGVIETDGMAPSEIRLQSAKRVLAQSCYRCHSELKSLESDADFLAAASLGDDSFPLVEAGKPEESELYRSLTGAGFGGTMPRRSVGLSQADIESLANWITNMVPDEEDVVPTPPPLNPH